MRPGSVPAAPSTTRRVAAAPLFGLGRVQPGAFIGALQGSFALLLWGWDMQRCSKPKRALLDALSDLFAGLSGVFICL